MSASGQCEEERITRIKTAIENSSYPKALDQFWTGKLRYGLSGSMVMYLDKTYGRNKLAELLKYNTLDEILNELQTTEVELIDEWAKFIGQYSFE